MLFFNSATENSLGKKSFSLMHFIEVTILSGIYILVQPTQGENRVGFCSNSFLGV